MAVTDYFTLTTAGIIWGSSGRLFGQGRAVAVTMTEAVGRLVNAVIKGGILRASIFRYVMPSAVASSATVTIGRVLQETGY